MEEQGSKSALCKGLGFKRGPRSQWAFEADRIQLRISLPVSFARPPDSVGAMTRTSGTGEGTCLGVSEVSTSKFSRAAPLAEQKASALMWHCLCVRKPHSRKRGRGNGELDSWQLVAQTSAYLDKRSPVFRVEVETSWCTPDTPASWPCAAPQTGDH